MSTLFKNQNLRYSLVLLGGLLLGWIFFHSSSVNENGQNQVAEIANVKFWTCAMHPAIHLEKRGKCPICGMNLIPLKSGAAVLLDPTALSMTKDALQLANVQTSLVSRQSLSKTLRLYGKVQVDERLVQSQVAYFSGRIEKLGVSFTGEAIRKGQKLALVYSPDLITAQQELLEAAATQHIHPAIYEAAKEKLRQWKLSEKQIAAIEQTKIVQPNVNIESNTSGVVVVKRVNVGDYVSQGSVLFEIADLSRLWVMLDAYEADVAFIHKGDKVDFTIAAYPGETFSGRVAFIDPVIDPQTRVAKVRVESQNLGGKLKPAMLATGILKSSLSAYQNSLTVPKSAVLWTGKRSVVYVKQPKTSEAIFKLREVELGQLLGADYVILNGVQEGEEIVTQGAFSVDAASQLEGKPSMMNH